VLACICDDVLAAIGERELQSFLFFVSNTFLSFFSLANAPVAADSARSFFDGNSVLHEVHGRPVPDGNPVGPWLLQWSGANLLCAEYFLLVMAATSPPFSS
jgi:hypothetical protein